MAFLFGTLAGRRVSNSLRHACAKGETVMAFSTGGRGPFQGQMNITPLIDVLLVLIIVFMVVQSMTKDKGLEAQIPQPAPHDANSPPPPDATVVLQVVFAGKDKQPSLRINQQDVSWDDLKS